MVGPMPDEVVGDDSGIALDANLRRKLAVEARLRREITDQLLRDLCEAEREATPRGAALFALAKVGMFVREISALDRDLGRFSGPAPDGVLFSLAHALAGLNEGTVDPIVAPATEPRRRVVDAAEDKHQGIRVGPTANVQLDRAAAAAAVEILMLAGRARKAAAQEVAKALTGASVLADIKGEPWRVIARWRDEIVARGEKREFPAMMGQDADYATQAAGRFNYLAGEARRWLDGGGAPADLVKLAHGQLDRMAG
jgi:hypothetical protein